MPAGLEASYDWIVVGAGAAGCVLANRLSADPAARVLLIEAGPSDTGVEAIRDAAQWVSLMRSEYDWGYDYEPTPEVLGRVIGIPRGKVLGGSSSINAMLWYRGHPDDYDAWEAAGATGWNWESMLPAFRASEDWERGATALRGAGGPMRIETSPDPHPIAEAMLDGAPEIGVPTIDDSNGESNVGAALANFTATTVRDPATGSSRMERWSTVRGYLLPALARPNLTVITDSQALRLVLEGSRCVGVSHLVDGVPVETRATSGVVLTLGAIGTPQLLNLSGIGAASALAALGLPVLHDLPGVGENYQDHPLVSGMNVAAGVSLGPMRDNGGGSMMNWRSSAAGDGADLHAFVVQESRPAAALEQDLSGDVFAISPGLMRSSSVGHVRLRSASPFEAPVIQPNFLREKEDLDRLVEGVEGVLGLLGTSPFRALGARPLVSFGAGSSSRAAIEDFVRRGVDTFFHSCGTARMGTDPLSVVSPSLDVHGVDGLWVADASVIPVIPTCNTQAPVIAIAERAAALIPGQAAFSA
ncbi:GMC family oxidoreductase [Frondihabitans australicus]|uniref:Choline dehydrogenase n=1 Tax=Frondihabitans australicus TaxID=386892 RepID=A0A495IGQ8_9MICO|nr:GMC family oxidoreductase N-terminal domain-containing protein [Frondihabitans australicus]RKR74949.1 choline dehydrogenase [Frondihabitans australicus]